MPLTHLKDEDYVNLREYFDNLPKRTKTGRKPKLSSHFSALLHQMGYNQAYLAKRVHLSLETFVLRLRHPGKFTLAQLLTISEAIGVPFSKVLFLALGFDPHSPPTEQIWNVKGLKLEHFDNAVRIKDKK